jgi:hypothetical protein
MFVCYGRQAGAFVEPVAGHLSYPFIDVQSLLSVSESPPFEILTLRTHLMAQIAGVGASHFYFDLTRTEFNRVRDTAPPRFIASFTVERRPAFPSSSIRDVFYSRNSIMPGNPNCPFPDGRHLSHELADQIRKWAEMELCQYCGAISLRRMAAGFVVNHSNIRFAIICSIHEIHQYCGKLANSVGRIRTFLDCSITVCGMLSNTRKSSPQTGQPQMYLSPASSVPLRLSDNSSLPSMQSSTDVTKPFHFNCIIAMN